jgi:hypothetical protein
MKKFFILAIPLVFGLTPTFAETAQQDTVFNQVDHLNRRQGHWKKRYKNGEIAYHGFFKDDKPRGDFSVTTKMEFYELSSPKVNVAIQQRLFSSTRMGKKLQRATSSTTRSMASGTTMPSMAGSSLPKNSPKAKRMETF